MKKLALSLAVMLSLNSCLTRQDLQYLQTNKALQSNEGGMVSYNIPEYKLNRNDILSLNIVTTAKGDAEQFYSALNTSGTAGGGGTGASGAFYFSGLKLNEQGEIYVFGIGLIKAEGRTVGDIAKDIQQQVNKNFVQGKSEVRLNLEGIRYFFLSDMGKSGEFVAAKQSLTILEAIASNGGLDNTIDRKKVRIYRKHPEGTKMAEIDLTREDLQNSPYYYVQNGDMVMFDTRTRNLNGFGKEPLQTITTGVSILTAGISVYLLIKNLSK
jgi:polysaccharide biosynthesis/export protein